MRALTLGGTGVGGGTRCFVIAEAGVNHNGELTLARKLVDAAAEAGADAVKFQTFEPSRLASAAAPKADYQRRDGGAGDGQRAMLEKLALSAEAHRELKAHAERRGILFLSSPFDEASGDFLDTLGVPAFKVPSGELTNLPFLRHLARKGRPLLVSTGMATLAEVADAVAAIRGAGDPALALFHCVSAYPADAADANLRAMATLRQAFDVPVGWSDHTDGVAIAIAAAAVGAELLEKHLTLDRGMPGPDHAASLEPAAFAALVRGVREAERALGDGAKAPRPAELPIAAVARKSLHYVAALPAGAVLRHEDLVALRPGTGLSPAALDRVVGRRLTRAVDGGAIVREGDLA